MPTISLCMIVKNEEHYLAECLESVKELVDEIIIVDTGSTDATKQIAESHNAKIIDFEWTNNFSDARNESLRHATQEWILILDADERLDEDGIAQIKECIESDDVAFALEQRSYVNGNAPGSKKNESEFEPIKKYPYYVSFKPVRLFKNGLDIEYRNRIHELVEHSLKDKELSWSRTKIVIHHLGSVKDPEYIREKEKYYRGLILQQVKDDPKNPRYSYEAAKMYEDEGNQRMALAMYLNCAKLKPCYKSVYAKIGNLFLRAGQGSAALQSFEKAVEHNPHDPSNHNNLAVVLMKKGDFVHAKEVLDAAIEKFPNVEALKKNRDACLKKLEQ